MQALSAIGDDDKYQEEEAVVDVDEEGNPLDADGNVIDNGYYYDDNGVDDYDEEEDADEEGVEEGMVEGGEEGGRKPTLGLGLPDDFFSKAGPTGMTETKGTTRKRMAPEATPTYSTRDGGQKRSFRGSGGGR